MLSPCLPLCRPHVHNATPPDHAPRCASLLLRFRTQLAGYVLLPIEARAPKRLLNVASALGNFLTLGPKVPFTRSKSGGVGVTVTRTAAEELEYIAARQARLDRGLADVGPSDGLVTEEMAQAIAASSFASPSKARKSVAFAGDGSGGGGAGAGAGAAAGGSGRLTDVVTVLSPSAATALFKGSGGGTPSGAAAASPGQAKSTAELEAMRGQSVTSPLKAARSLTKFVDNDVRGAVTGASPPCV